MLEYIINFILNSKPTQISIVLLILYILIILFILFIIISYFSIKLLKFSIDNNNLFFYQKYSQKCKKLINIYGQWEITKVFLVKQPIGYLDKLVINLFTLFNYSKLINKSKKSKKYIAYHISFIIQIKNTKNGKIKLLSLDKNLSITMRDTFIIKKSYKIKSISLDNIYTLHNLLEITQKRLGNRAFFNWSYYKNNCQDFAKQILLTLGVYNSKIYDKYIFKDKIAKLYNPSCFASHILKCCIIFLTFLQKYVNEKIIIF
jgi:hypothetical protein